METRSGPHHGRRDGWLLLSSATSAVADYGSGTVDQVEISDNGNGTSTCEVASGFGVWLWIELIADGTGDDEGTDCAHQAITSTGSSSGAAHESGDVT